MTGSINFPKREVRKPEVKFSCPKCRGKISGLEPYKKHVAICRGKA